jgi:hypothetical protein
LHHVVLALTNPITEQIVFNYRQEGSEKSLYQYVTIYDYVLGAGMAQSHYEMYTEKSKYQSSGSTLSLSENSVNIYNNDWIVLQNS